jgi:hypothetical protein
VVSLVHPRRPGRRRNSSPQRSVRQARERRATATGIVPGDKEEVISSWSPCQEELIVCRGRMIVSEGVEVVGRR